MRCGYCESHLSSPVQNTYFQGAVVRVSSVEQVAVVVRFSTDHRIPLAVKGGGYSTGGYSSAKGGIILDMSNLRRVHVETSSHMVIAEGGALWDDIDVAAAQHDLAVVGSTLGQIGAAGATLGGGYGWLSGQYGLAIDNLLWARMVLADGSVVTTAADQNPDLFWAIRGAGQSFGVAVELAFRAHSQSNPVYAGTLVFSEDKLPEIVDFANQFETLTDGRQGFWFGFNLQPSSIRCSIVVIVFHNGARAAGETFFSPLLTLRPTLINTQMLPYDSLNSILNVEDTLIRRSDFTGVDTAYHHEWIAGHRKRLSGSNIALPLDIDFVTSIYHQFDEFLRMFPEARDSRLFFEFLPNLQIRKVLNDATAFASRGPYYNISSLFRWQAASLDERIQFVQTDMMDKIGTLAGIASKPNYHVLTHGTGLYANYAGRSSRSFML